MGQLFEDKLTVLSEGEAVYSLKEAWFKLYGSYPSNDSLALLYAQTALETGRWKSMHCNNWGNIKRASDEDYCMFRCNEIINGHIVWFDPPNKATWFRAYPTAVDGAYDYLRFLSQKSRYQGAWQAIQHGNPTEFAHALKEAGYYTASEALYTKGVVSLTNEFKKRSEELLAWKPPTPAEPDRRSQLPTIEPTGDEPAAEPAPIEPAPAPADDFHPDQENTKHIEVPSGGFVALLEALFQALKGLF